jgi:plastocyanin
MHGVLRLAIFGVGLCAGAVAHAVEPHDVTIRMQKESFVPAQISVAAGTRITWTNDDSMPHSVTAADNGLDSGPIMPGKTFQWTATDTGTIAYHCIFHPSMTAQLTVRAASGTAAQ